MCEPDCAEKRRKRPRKDLSWIHIFIYACLLDYSPYKSFGINRFINFSKKCIEQYHTSKRVISRSTSSWSTSSNLSIVYYPIKVYTYVFIACFIVVIPYFRLIEIMINYQNMVYLLQANGYPILGKVNFLYFG